MTRILLAYPGGEVLLHKYKTRATISQVTTKMSTLASTLFASWDWCLDAEIAAIWDLEHNRAIIAVDGPTGEDCFL